MTGATPFADLPRRTAGVILADPPWNFITYSPKGWRKSAHAHYPCMDFAEVLALPVAELAAPDAVLVLWTTQVHQPHALAVFDAWGFAFKTMGTWAKQSKTGRRWQFGTGYLLRSAAEFFLVGTRGRPHQLSRSSRNLIVAPVREHSRKPDEMYDLIEATWPGPHLELFARYPRAGWMQWSEPPHGRTPQTFRQTRARPNRQAAACKTPEIGEAYHARSAPSSEAG